MSAWKLFTADGGDGKFCNGLFSILICDSGISLCRTLAIAVKHHTTVSTGNIRACKGVPGIFVGNNGTVYIMHRVQGNLIGLV